MNTEELNSNVASVHFEGVLNPQSKCISKIEIEVRGEQKHLVFIFSKAFEESPEFLDLMKTAIQFVEFKKGMKEGVPPDFGEMIRSVLGGINPNI